MATKTITLAKKEDVDTLTNKLEHLDDDKEDYWNKTDDIETNKESSTHYASTKGVVDYVSGVIEPINEDISNEVSRATEAEKTLDNRLTLVEAEVLELISENFDGTKKTYNRLMKEWFLDHGAETATPAELTTLCDKWYAFTRTGWNGYTTFAQPNISTVSTGTKGGDNADMVCVPSTNETAGQDDYAGLPQFAVKDCNWILTDDGDIQITAIDGITSNFERYDPTIYVGVLQMSMLHYWYEDDESYTHGITDDLSDDSYENAKPYPEAIKLDGTVRSWVCHGKYMSQDVDGKMTCCAGLVPSENIYSHDALVTKSKANGAYYSGGTVTDWSFLVLMTFIKYGSMSLDDIVQGCVSYYNQIPVSVESTDVNYVIVSNTNAAKILIGSTVRIGSSNSYGTNASYDISGRYGRIVESKEVYDDSNMLIHISGDVISTLTTSYVTTWHWQSGSNDKILGNDGGCIISTNGQCAGKLQGIEFAVGGYEVFGDVILYLDGENYCLYTVSNATKQKSSAKITTDGYTDTGLRSAQPATASWNYISKLGFDGRELFQEGTSNGSSSKFYRDPFYKYSVDTKSVYREWLAFGFLSDGSGFGGLSCLRGSFGLGTSYWYFLARLSPNGNRGELTA